MVLGITGITGVGKHLAAEFLAQKGWTILDVDKIGHYLYRPYTHVWKAVIRRFGETILNQDDHINRAKLGALVFDEKHPEQSEKNRLDLNKIVHPAIRRYLKEQIHSHYRRQSPIAIVAALWKEIDLPKLCDKILLIKADGETGMRRVQKRDGISSGAHALRVQSQTDPPAPDFIIHNNGSLQDFYKTLNALKIGTAIEKDS